MDLESHVFGSCTDENQHLARNWPRVIPSESFDQCSEFNTCLAGVCSSTFVTSTSTQDSKVTWRLFEKGDDSDEGTIKLVSVDEYDEDVDTPVNFKSGQKDYCLRVFKPEGAGGSNTLEVAYFDDNIKKSVPNSQVFIEETGVKVKCFTID